MFLLLVLVVAAVTGFVEGVRSTLGEVAVPVVVVLVLELRVVDCSVVVLVLL